MHFKRHRPRDIEVNLTPLIDVVFLLLIFFMVSTTFTDKTELVIDLPEAKASVQIEKPQSIEVVVTQLGNYSINGESLINNERLTLKAALAKISDGDLQTAIIITADAMAPHQSVVRILDVAGELGFNKLSITALEPTG